MWTFPFTSKASDLEKDKRYVLRYCRVEIDGGESG